MHASNHSVDVGKRCKISSLYDLFFEQNKELKATFISILFSLFCTEKSVKREK